MKHETSHDMYTLHQIEDSTFYELDYKGDYKLNQVVSIYDAHINEHTSMPGVTGAVIFKETKAMLGINGLGCAAFLSKRSDGAFLYGRNFDYRPHMTPVIVHTHPVHGYASITICALEILSLCTQTAVDKLEERQGFSFAPYLPLEGMNEKGLCISILTADDCKSGPTNETGKEKDTEISLAVRMILDQTANVSEAVELLTHYNIHSWNDAAYHFMIADAAGDSAVVEFYNNKMQVYRGREENQLCTNFSFDPWKESIYSSVDKTSGITSVYPEGKTPKDLCWRYDRAMSYMKEKDWSVSDDKEAMQVLKSIMQYEGNSESFTMWSCVYDLTEHKLQLCLERDYGKVFEFSI